MAREAGLRRLKLYFMVGLPGERDEDVAAIAGLVREVKARLVGGRLSLSVAPFVPKPHTPFQWAGMAGAAELQEAAAFPAARAAPAGGGAGGGKRTLVACPGCPGAGDRRLAGVLARMEGSTLADWRRALAEEGLDEEEYLRPRRADEPFPWEVVAPGVGRPLLWREWEASAGAANLTPRAAAL